MKIRTLEEILNDIGIDQLQSTPTGFRGCCKVNPDHHDRKPSMHIHVEKGLVKCFSCGTFKPLFSFLLDNDVPFDEAIGFMFTDFEHKKNDPKGMQEWILGRKIPKSMLDRGFAKGTLKHFGVGYDEYEKHITIPCRYKGVLYGINYRKDTPRGKKVWSSVGFVKDNFIYNYKATKDRIYVEGFSDTWRVWQNGENRVSATLTANVSEGQLSMMAVHKRIYIAYDNDKAGYRGAFKIHKELGRKCEIFMVPYSGKDPEECSKVDWERAMKNARTFTEFEVVMLGKNPELYDELKK